MLKMLAERRKDWCELFAVIQQGYESDDVSYERLKSILKTICSAEEKCVGASEVKVCQWVERCHL